MSLENSTNKMVASLAKLTCYKEAVELEEDIWNIVAHWSHFARDTVGKQIVRAADSIGANISEGFGREHLKDKIKFYIYARASSMEVMHWVLVSSKRNLISEEKATELQKRLKHLPTLINSQIAYTKTKLKY